jgi:hypothetical protein
MIFVFSKLAFILLRPSNLFLILDLIGLAGLWRRPRAWAKALLAFSVGLTLIVVLLPIGGWLMAPLENRFPPPAAYPPRIDGVVVLGGGVASEITAARGMPTFSDPGERYMASCPRARVLEPEPASAPEVSKGDPGRAIKSGIVRLSMRLSRKTRQFQQRTPTGRVSLALFGKAEGACGAACANTLRSERGRRNTMYLYVMGRGHSGSTILGILLGGGAAIASVGEVVSGLGRYALGTEICSCGTPMHECSFWTEVRRRFEGEDHSWAEFVRRVRAETNVLRWLPTRLARPDEAVRLRLATMTQAFARAIATTAGKPHVLDTNKETTRGLFLL